MPLPRSFRRFAPLVFLAGATLLTGAGAAESAPVFKDSIHLQALVDRAVQTALDQFAARKLQREQLAITLVDLRNPELLTRASHRGDAMIYPASVIKLFYLAAAHRWLEDGKLEDTPELRRALQDMIVRSGNDPTHYVVDLLTGTTSGPELPGDEIKTWFEKRNAVTRYFASLGYTGVLVHKKPWAEGPYGRESQATRLFDPKRNMLTTDATARLMSEIALRRCVSAGRSEQMLKLLARDPATPESGADTQARFMGPSLPAGAKLWSKAGWTSQTRHDAACIELPNGARFVLVVFTTDHAREHEIIRTIAKVVAENM